MSIRNLLKFSFDNMSRNIKKAFVVVFLQVIIFVLIGQVLIEYNKRKYDLDKCENILSAPLEKCESVSIEAADLSEDRIIEFAKEIYKIDGFLAVGGGCCGEVGIKNTIFDGKLRNIQMSNPEKTYFQMSDELLTREIQVTLLPYYNFNYIDKIDIKEEQSFDTVYLVLGNAYKDIPVGSEYVKKYTDGFEAHYVVAGILEKGEEFIETSIGSVDVIEIKNCDYEIFIMFPMEDYQYAQTSISYAIDDNHTVEEIHSEIIRIVDKYGIERKDVSFLNAKRGVEISNEPMNYVLGMLLDIATIVIIATVLISICIQSVTIIDSMNMYGIMYANGITRRDVKIIVILENLVKTVLAVITAYAFGRWYYDMAFDVSISFKAEIEVLNSIVIYEIVGIALVIMAVSTIVPLIIINKNTPSKLIRGI